MKRLAVIAPLIWLGCSSPAPETSTPRYSATESQTPDGVGLIVLHDAEAGVEASVAPSKGANVSSIKVRFKDQWIETIYGANNFTPGENYEGKSPTLWPAVGRNVPDDMRNPETLGGSLPVGGYDYDGKRYKMPGHGFARDYAWEVAEFGADQDAGAWVSMFLEDNEQTRELYPFGFRLMLEVRLSDGVVEMAYGVTASEANDDDMFFSIGNHITFNTPLVASSELAEMLFVSPSKTEIMKEAGMPTGELRPRSHAEPFELKDWEVRNAVSLAEYDGDPWMELLDPSGLGVRMSHTASQWPEQPLIQFNVWGDVMDGFFSPEPWVGLQNSLVLKQGLVYVKPGDDFDWTVRIEFLR